MTEVFPPYHSVGQAFTCEVDGGAQFHCEGNTASADKNSGKLYTLNENIIWRPGNYAWQHTFTQAVMHVAFKSPVSGRLRIVANLECGDSHYYTAVDDESGWSDNHIRQLSKLEMFIGLYGTPNSVKYTFVDYNTTFPENEDGWRYNLAEPGEITRFEFVTRSTHTAGQWVIPSIMITDDQNIRVDDMQVYGEIKHDWTLRKLDVTGAQ